MEGSDVRLLQHRKLYIFTCLLFVLWFVSFNVMQLHVTLVCSLALLTSRFGSEYLCDAWQIGSPMTVTVALRSR